MTLYTTHNMTDLMFQWVALTVLCEKQAWPDIESLFITKVSSSVSVYSISKFWFIALLNTLFRPGEIFVEERSDHSSVQNLI